MYNSAVVIYIKGLIFWLILIAGVFTQNHLESRFLFIKSQYEKEWAYLVEVNKYELFTSNHLAGVVVDDALGTAIILGTLIKLIGIVGLIFCLLDYLLLKKEENEKILKNNS